MSHDLLESGRAAWPALRVDEAAFAEHVATLTRAHGAPIGRHAADLYLAFACGVAARGAHEAFDARYAEPLVRAASRAVQSESIGDEAVQALRMKLFLHEPRKILDYGGRAKLSTWLATAVTRTALNLLDTKSHRDNERLRTDRFVARGDPELDYLRAKVGAEVEPALVAALAKLTDKERTLLRLHFAEGMSIDALAEIYRVGRSTTARWLAVARETLLDHAQAALQERLGVTPTELRRLGADLKSGLEVSLLRLL